MTLHDFTLTGAFVVNATQVEHSMNYHTVQLSAILLPYFLSIGGYGLQGNHHVA